MMIVFQDFNKRYPLELVDPPFNNGAEGKLYKIANNRGVVKLFIDKKDALRKKAKIFEMDRMRKLNLIDSSVINSTTWPLGTVFDNNGDFIGYGMKTVENGINFKAIAMTPALQGLDFTIKEKILILIDLCSLLEKMHNSGIYFGDLNPDNLNVVKINGKNKVIAIDTDSFHINSKLRCDVCARGYAAPELIRKTKGSTYADYKGDTFNEYTDCFGLAVHIFRFMFNGVHPFDYEKDFNVKDTDRVQIGGNLDKRVEKFQSPYYKTLRGYSVKHFAPMLNDFPEYITNLFKKAFVDGDKNPSSRPSAAEWKIALEKYAGELKSGCNDVHHAYSKQLKKCPYCEANKRHKERSKIVKNHTASTASNNTNKNSVAPPAPGNNTATVNVTSTNKKKRLTPLKALAASFKFNFSNLKNGDNALFWIITVMSTLIIDTACVLLYGIDNMLPFDLFGGSVYLDQTYIILSMIGSIAGVYISNSFICPGRYQRKHSIIDYLLADLIGVVSLALFIPLFALAAYLAVFVFSIAIMLFFVALFVG